MKESMESRKLDLTKLEKILSKYKGQEGVLISVLQEVQAEFGWVPREAIKGIANALKVSLGRVYGILTFYAQFYLTPRGEETRSQTSYRFQGKLKITGCFAFFNT